MNSVPREDDENAEHPEKNYAATQDEIARLLETVKDEKSVYQPGGGDKSDIIIKKAFNNPDALNKEYQELLHVPISNTIAFKAAPKVKNRYTDVPCLDNNRVVLKGTDNNYIHANFVDGYKQSKAYICCQGPVDESIDDFWHMIWQEDVLVIAMLTKCNELNTVKCAQYWPMKSNETTQHGVYQVHCKTHMQKKNYEYTEICLTHYSVDKRSTLRCGSGESRPVIHLLFTEWPDRGVPNNCDKFLQFVHLVRKAQLECLRRKPEWKEHPLGPPIVVHCSAGIGRTGTFCVVDVCCQMLHDTQMTNVMETAKLMRTQRAMAVQKPEQYIFIYLCVIVFVVKANIHIPSRGESKAIAKATNALRHQKELLPKRGLLRP